MSTTHPLHNAELSNDRAAKTRAAATNGGSSAGITMNLVSRRVGSGTFVRYRGHADHEDIAELTSPLELIDVRLVVEPQMARLAVMNANAQDLQRMREALNIVEASKDNVEEFSRGDEAFHLALAESSRNPLLLWLYRHINEVRRHTQWNARKDKILTPQRIAEYNQQHRQLYTAIASRDMEQALKTTSTRIWVKGEP
jgi:DNA-binding FadR family transcriptional regulator